MPTVTTKNIFIIYEAKDERCALLIKEMADTQLPRLFEFFELHGFSRPRTIIIYPTAASYRDYKLATSGYYEDWMIGEQKGYDIRILTHSECVKTEAHSGQTEEEFLKTVLHELVHACQQEIGSEESDETEWFWEALATNLSRQYDTTIPITCTYDDLLYHFENIDGLYETFYTLGRYMLDHLEHSELLRFIQEPSYLLANAQRIFHDAKRTGGFK